jgi:Domain of unknown function DUF11
MRAMRTTILLGALAITGLTASIQAPDADAAKVNCKAAQVTNKGLCKALNKCEKKRGKAKRRCRSAAMRTHGTSMTEPPPKVTPPTTPAPPTQVPPTTPAPAPNPMPAPNPAPAPNPTPAPNPAPRPPEADMEVTVASDKTSFGEDRMTFDSTVTARNNGPMNVHAQNATVLIRAAAGATLELGTFAGGSCTPEGSTVLRCDIGQLPSDKAIVIDVRAAYQAIGDVHLTAEITSERPELNPRNNTHGIVIPAQL